MIEDQNNIINLKNIANPELLKLIKQKAFEEKALTLEVINLIREIDRRKLYLGLGFSSLFDYVTRELGYEEAAALRRISAARLIKDIPEVETKILEGSLNLSTVTQAQSFFRKEEKINNKKLSTDEKKEILFQLENKSAREAQKTLLAISPEQITLKESQKIVSEIHTELKFVIDDELKTKLDKLKSLLSHQHPYISMAELINKLADMALNKLAPTKPNATKNTKFTQTPSTSKVQNVTKKLQSSKNQNAANQNPNNQIKRDFTGEKTSRYISAKTKKEVWQRDNSQCAFIDPISKRRCHSKYQLEIHHEKPFAMGGENNVENLKLFCKQHNAYQAVQDYGLDKIKIYRPSLTS